MNTLAPAQLICGAEALATFRQGLTGPCAFDLLRQSGGRLLIQLPVGVGKSEWLVQIIDHALNTACEHDLVVVLVPRWDVLEELRTRLPGSVTPLVLHPRPRKRCGPLDGPWVGYEQTGCGLLGREELCSGCPRRRRCSWPEQYGERLRGAKLVLGTQQHLVLNPQFIDQLRQSTGAQRVLLLLDESDLLLKPAERTIRREELEHFVAAQEAVQAGTPHPPAWMKTCLYLSDLLGQAPTQDLQCSDWRYPRFDGSWAVTVQKVGRQKYGSSFRFLGYDLRHFGRSDQPSREKLPSGDIRFAALPDLGDEFIVFSGSMAKELARYRLDPDHRRPALLSPFALIAFRHPQTRWYNIGSFEGAASYFPHNAERVLDFFAVKVARNIEAGKRTLLVCRKRFRELCQQGLTTRLREHGIKGARIVTGNWDRVDLSCPKTVPLITYGICGVNRFEEYDAAYCLSGYYISASTVAATVQDIDATPYRFPISICNEGTPRRRCARVEQPPLCESILPVIAQGVLVQKEADVVVQAVGRVRPFTKPREVITFQVGTLPGVEYNLAFPNLVGARSYFQVPTRRESKKVELASQISALREQGLTQKEVAERLDISAITVKRYEKKTRDHKHL